MDSSIVTDPRFRILAHRLDWDFKTVIGACYLAWLACYERRSATLTIEEVSVCVDSEAFASAYASVGLGDIDNESETITFHGAEKRIEFLKKQAERGAKGGRKSRPTKKKRRKEANASGKGSKRLRETEAYTPAPTPTQAHTHTLFGADAPAREGARASSRHDYLVDWNAFAEQRKGVPNINLVTNGRRQKIKAREAEGFSDAWPTILSELEAADDWIAGFQGFSFDWLIKNSENWVKVAEGKFRNRANGARQDQDRELAMKPGEDDGWT